MSWNPMPLKPSPNRNCEYFYLKNKNLSTFIFSCSASIKQSVRLLLARHSTSLCFLRKAASNTYSEAHYALNRGLAETSLSVKTSISVIMV